MSEIKNSKDLLLLIERRTEKTQLGKKEKNKPNIIYDEGFKSDDKLLKGIMSQFIKNKKHIEAVKKIDSGDYTEEYFKENLPHYSPKLHKVLEKCSSKKYHDDKSSLDHKEGDYIINFD